MVNVSLRRGSALRPAAHHAIEAPRTAAGRGEVENDEAVERAPSSPLVHERPEAPWRVRDEVRERHQAGQDERNRARERGR